MDFNKFRKTMHSGSTSSFSSRTDNSYNSIRVPGRGGQYVQSQGPPTVLRRNPRNNKRYNRGHRDNNTVGQRDTHPMHQSNQSNHSPHNRVHVNASSSGNVSINLNQSEINGSKYYICPGCKQPYNYYKSTNILCGRVPRVLPCIHTVCEECIKKSIKTTNQIWCPTCTESIRVKKDQNFEYNYYILGQITCSRISDSFSLDYSSIGLVSTHVKPEESPQSEGVEKCALGDCSNRGTVSCIDCSGIYCNECDKTLHNSGKHLKTHKRMAIERKLASLELTKCPDHSMLEELHCTKCNQSCCCYCMLEKHEGHGRSYLLRLSKDEEEDLKKGYDLASKNLKHLLKTQQKMTKPEDDKVSEIELEVSRCFTDIHAQLHSIEKKLREEGRMASNCSAKLTELRGVVLSNIENIKYLLHCVDHRDDMKLNLRGLISRLKDMEVLPTCLVSAEKSDGTTRLILDERLRDLEDYFKIVSTEINPHRLVSRSELPQDYSQEEDSAQVTANASAELPAESGSKKTINALEIPDLSLKLTSESPRSKNSGPELKSSLMIIASNEGRRVKTTSYDHQEVFITHINNLDCFYVQLKKDNEHFKKLERDIKKHVANKTSLGVRNADLNELYMAPLLFNNKEWGRVQVLENIEKESGTDYKVTFIDYGNCTIVQATALKHISNKLAKIPAFAHKCKLDNPSGIDLPEDSRMKLAKLLDGARDVTMVTKDIKDGVYVVDLNLRSSLGDSYSIIDLLVADSDILNSKFSNLEASESSYHGPTSKIFDNNDKFDKGESYDIFISYVLDPWNMYVRKVSYENSLVSLRNAMEDYYKNTECDIHIPIKGSDVVISYPSKDYGNWHRARIQQVFGIKQIVNVFLVDWGKQVNVSLKNIRKLAEMFRKSDCLAVKVKLAAVGPKSDHGWSHPSGAEARAFLEKFAIKDKEMKMLVAKEDPLEVVIFECQPAYNQNINALLVENDFAASTDKLSQTVLWINKKEEEKTDEAEFLPIYKEYMDDDDSDDETQGFRTQVEIVRFDHPHSIFISFVAMKSEAEKLNEELNIHYKQQIDTRESWNINDKVVVFNEEENSFQRGRITCIQGETYYVYLLDKGQDLVVSLKDLRDISPYFLNFPNRVFTCHLVNIKPAGDSKNWSQLSIEWFQKLFSKYKEIYIKKLFDDTTKSSIPVTMWYSKVIQGNALEPSSRKFFSIDNKVVNAGLAFRVKNEIEHSTHIETNVISESIELESISDQVSLVEKVESELNEKKLSEEPSLERLVKIDHLSKEQEFVKEWLPPMPIKKTEFCAFVTCVETEGHLFIRDEEFQTIYKEMENNMTEHFDSISKPESFDMHEYQMVTIWYEQRWYRGLILNVIDKETAKVMMVDYGSDHVVKMEHLHNEIMYPTIPLLATKIKLYDVYSKTLKWSTSDFDNLMDTVSEYSKIVIRSREKASIPLADVYNMKGVCLNDELVKLSENLYRKKSKPHESPGQQTEETSIESYGDNDECSGILNLLEKPSWSSMVEDEKNNICKDYTYVPLPKVAPGQKVEMDIISVYDYRTVSIFVQDDSNEEEFNALSRIMQEECKTLEHLKNLEVGMPCVSLFHEDGLWYRATVFHIDPKLPEYVTVIYVDYGNFEIINCKNVRQIKPEWLDIPAKFLVAKIACKLIDQERHDYLLKHMQQLMNTTRAIEIIKEQPLLIHVYNEDGTLYYDSFVKINVLCLSKLGVSFQL